MARGELGAEPLAEAEMFEVQPDIDRQPLAAGPIVSWPGVACGVGISVMGTGRHGEMVAGSSRSCLLFYDGKCAFAATLILFNPLRIYLGNNTR